MSVNLKSKKITAAVVVLLMLSIVAPLLAGASQPVVSPVINYAEETITLSGGSGDGTVRYMYSPNANKELTAANYTNAGAKKLAAEKWYPVYGNSIDISKLIPKADSVVFAFRDAGQLPNSDGVYSSRIISAEIPARPKIAPAEFKKNAVYMTSAPEASAEVIKITGELLAGYEYRVGISSWVDGGDGQFIDVNSKYNPLGGTVAIRKKATESSFASAEYKIKIPKAPAAPKLKINNNKIIGIKTNVHKWCASEDGEYNDFTYSSIDLKTFEQQMNINPSEFTTVRENDKDYIVIFIKIPATDKKPSSTVQRLLIEKSLFSQSAAT